MSTEQERVRAIAERIARRVSQAGAGEEESAERVDGNVGGELAAMRASLEELQQRLVQIESHITHEGDRVSQKESGFKGQQGNARSEARAASGVRSPWLSGMYVPAAHPSEERFGVEEAAVSELVDFFENEKKCELEPGGKPCDHCSMCSTRGF